MWTLSTNICFLNPIFTKEFRKQGRQKVSLTLLVGCVFALLCRPMWIKGLGGRGCGEYCVLPVL